MWLRVQPLGDPMYSVSLSNIDARGYPHLVLALPRGSTYTPAQWWPIKLAAGVNFPAGAPGNTTPLEFSW